MIHLNHAGTSWPKPACVRDAVAETLAAPELSDEGFDRHHESVARAFGVGDTERLLLTPGATQALAVAVADHPWQRGDRIVLSGLEHHALQRPAQQLRSRGVETIVVPPTATEPIDVTRLREVLSAGRVRMVATTAACNVTGEQLPIEAIARLAHEYGALHLVDGAQTAGWIDVDFDASPFDLFAFAGHKGPQAPWGIGGLLRAPHVRFESPWAGATKQAPGPCDVGSVDRAALAGLAAGLEWLAEPERADRLAKARALASTLRAVATEGPDVTLHGAARAELAMPTVALTSNRLEPNELARRLAARDVTASGGLHCAPLAHQSLGTWPDGALRLSFGPASTTDDADHAAGALRETLAAAD